MLFLYTLFSLDHTIHPPSRNELLKGYLVYNYTIPMPDFNTSLGLSGVIGVKKRGSPLTVKSSLDSE